MQRHLTTPPTLPNLPTAALPAPTASPTAAKAPHPRLGIKPFAPKKQRIFFRIGAVYRLPLFSLSSAPFGLRPPAPKNCPFGGRWLNPTGAAALGP
ncbi:MAG: hypothetical protein EAY75_14195, partial [Bacteroidetes bacterium]